MEPRISLITLGVADLERATRFYEHGFGLPRLPTPPSEVDALLAHVATCGGTVVRPAFPHG